MRVCILKTHFEMRGMTKKQWNAMRNCFDVSEK